MRKNWLPASVLCLVLAAAAMAGDTLNPGSPAPAPTPQDPAPQTTTQTTDPAPAQEPLAGLVFDIVTALASLL